MDKTQLVRNLHSYIENAEWDELSNLLADNFIFEGPVPEPIGKDAFINMHRPILTGIPNLRYNLEDLQEEGDKVTGTLGITGTHTGTLDLTAAHGPVLEPTNNEVRLPRDTFTMWWEGDKVTKIYSMPSEGGGMEGLLHQLGAPAPAPAPAAN